jgi:hypothetical protein
MVMSRDQREGKNRNVNVGNKIVERNEPFKYLGTNLTNQSSIQEEIKSSLKSECLLSSSAECLVL